MKLGDKMLENIRFGNADVTTVGIDVGSTTVKAVVIKDGKIVFNCYERHMSAVRAKTIEVIKRIKKYLDGEFKIVISGSAGIGIAQAASLTFIQEVYATSEALKIVAPDTDVAIELGGEDAKVIFFRGVTDSRMNGSCAGGTGAFIDQMATLLNIDNTTLDKLSLEHTKIYPIASRCGVFAKTDIQPLINQGALKSDIAASIYQAVVNQTISGLVQGYEIKGKVMFLGGPLYHLHGLRERFAETLKLSKENAVFPEYGLITVALGCAAYAAKIPETTTYEKLVSALENADNADDTAGRMEPLFKDDKEYEEFVRRHSSFNVPSTNIETYTGNAYLGIDCGSTTTKMVLLDENDGILYSYYSSNKGNPLDVIKKCLLQIYDLCGDRIKIKSSAVTGYGEELTCHAFGIDSGIVETMAHFYAARHFNPQVDFILDIGGQDIKCFKIRNNAVDSIMLNEACSSGCGSFIETFANLAGYDAKEFAKIALKAKNPVDLGSRCTVFMNSSVKQAQKDGADIADISAGLSISVVKNAIYKVIRANSASELGKNIVVQGGTFLNDAVLRSFEKELGSNVIRPSIAGLMGAYGAALYAKGLKAKKSALIGKKGLEEFSHTVKAVNCNGCENHCNLTVNIFSDGKRFISGNKCDKGAGVSNSNSKLPNLYEYKRKKLEQIKNSRVTDGDNAKIKIGIPMALSVYELAPLWQELFTQLGFDVVFTDFSTHKTYVKGQHTIPSDTVCYPAKLMHGHIQLLLEQNVNAVFYPCLTYNFDEQTGDNHYNCPVVAYYSELLRSNIKALEKTTFLAPYLNINNRKEFSKEMYKLIKEKLPDAENITYRRVYSAVGKALDKYSEYMNGIVREGERAINYARENGKRIVVLAGRPYHTDPEICHMIDKLTTSLGFAVISEDCLTKRGKKPGVDVLNQWTYHARLYNAAIYASNHKDTELVQLVSFGCGIDAITTDEVKTLLESKGKIYTELKIDEINNLGAVKIRLRSLMAALEDRG